jgi:putative redox protein
MDIVAILRKAGKQLQEFNLKVSGELSKQPPLEYTSTHIVYEMKGNAEDREAVLDAVKQSQEKICGISHMLKKIIPVTWQVIYNGKEIFNNQREALAQLN